MLPKRFFAGFRYAYTGILTAIREERNMRFHLCAALYVVLFSRFYDLDRTQNALVAVMICGVLALELVNSSIERTVERPAPDRYMTAGVVKDMAAGAVLIFSVGAGIGGLFLFWDVTVFARIFAFFTQNWVALICLLASFVVSYLFIFHKEKTP